MAVERLALTDPVADAARVRALAPGAASVTADVEAIVAAVGDGGDEALRDYVERFDGVDGPLAVTGDELRAALAALGHLVLAGKGRGE